MQQPMKRRTHKLFSIAVFSIAALSCDKNEDVPSNGAHFEGKEKVTVTGYSDHIMEPFISKDGNVLLFNNYNGAPNTNLYWATRVDDVTFAYQGEVTGVNTTSLEGVPTMDKDGNFYFVSLREYESTLKTAFTGTFNAGTVTNVVALENISKVQSGWVNFDIEVDSMGKTLYFVDGRFDALGGPYEADIVIAVKDGSQFQRLANSDEILAKINTSALEYAACISANQLELYFTRVDPPLTDASQPEIFVATRQNVGEPFGNPVKIESITGFAEAATLAPGGDNLYYHAMDANGLYALYLTRRVHHDH